jgi:hypothetical protein
VSEECIVGQVIDGDHFDVLVFEELTKGESADTAEPVDCDFSSHERLF